jgi:hypothetical protein
MDTNMTVEAIKAKNLDTMRSVTQMLKDEQRAPKRTTKDVPMAKIVKATSAKFTGKETKLACSLRLIETYKVRDEFVKMLQGHFPELTEFNARCYFNKVRQG